MGRSRRVRWIVVPFLLAGVDGSAQTNLKLARLADIPDQYVGGEILRLVYARLNIAIEFVDVEAKRSLALSSSGQLDGEIQRIPNLDRDYPSLIPISTPINFIEPAVFTTTLRFEVKGWDSIKNYRIGIVRGVGSSERGTKGMDNVEAAKSLSNLILMLEHDHIDLFVTDLFSGRVMVKKMGLESRIKPLSPPLERIYLLHYLNERHRELVGKVDTGIRTMEASGEVAAIRQRLVDEAVAQAEP
jgi:ABC-type amino acid transport substrate-binding protein